jgi:two-component system, LytTR family, response regulator
MAARDSNRVRTLIVDDEQPGRALLRSLLARDEEIEITGEAASADEALRMISSDRPDLVFMDIEMPGGNAVEMLRDVAEPAPFVVFVTAHPEFTLPAFELQAVDYLLKPVERQRFSGSVQRAKQRVADRRLAGLAVQIAGITNGVNGAKGANGATGAHCTQSEYPDQMTIRVRRRLMSVDIGDIVWIQGASQYSRVHTKYSEYLLSRTLASLEGELDPTRFFRIHRSAIVNVAYVREVRSFGDGRYNVHLSGGQLLPLGRARRDVLEKLLSRIESSGS